MKTPQIYLVASYTIKPRNPALTFQKDYINQDANIQYSESVAIATRLKTSDLTDAQVIIDIGAKQVIKCSYQGAERNYESLITYYTKHYPSYVNPILERLGRLTKPSVTEITEGSEVSSEAQLSP
jgi:hypothetical protein